MARAHSQPPLAENEEDYLHLRALKQTNLLATPMGAKRYDRDQHPQVHRVRFHAVHAIPSIVCAEACGEAIGNGVCLLRKDFPALVPMRMKS